MNLSEFPLPIFTAYREYETASGYSDRFRSSMRLFTTVLKYCSITVIAEYLDYLEKGGEPDIQLTNLLYSNLFRPSLGHWNHFLRDLLLFRRGRTPEESSGFYFDLDGAYFEKRTKSSPGKLAVAFNELISIRNEWFHPGLDPDEKNAPGLAEEVDNKIGEILELLHFITRYKLYHIYNGEKFDLMGNTLSTWTEEDIEKLSPSERQIFLQMNDTVSIPLNFLIELKNSGEGNDTRFMLFETARIDRRKSIKLVKFILGNQWGFDERLYIDLTNEVRNLLKIEQKEEAPVVADLSWEHVDSAAHGTLRENLKQLEDLGKVIPLLYINRTQIEGKNGIFEQFLEDKKSRCLLILGDSGHGKTNTLWKLSNHPLLKEKKKNLAIFFYEARNIHPSGLHTELDQRMLIENSLGTLVTMMQNNDPKIEGKEFLLFIDAINEYSNPSLLMREILDTIPTNSDINLRFVVSCRTLSWNRILVTLTNQHEELIFTYLENSEKKYPSLSEYSEDELNAAFEKYREHYKIRTELNELSPRSIKLLEDPLILRLTTEAYRGLDTEQGKIPRELNISKIFESYDTKRKIDKKRDEPFLKNLIEQMWRQHRSLVEGTEVRNSNELQEIVYETPVNLSPGSTYQCSSCKSIYKIGDPNFHPGDPCPHCDSMSIHPVQKDWRTTYERLLDEGIITEDLQADDIAIRFVYDRYYEYRTARWILSRFSPLDLKIVIELIDHAHHGDAPILLEAVKLAVMLSENYETILPGLATSENQSLKDMAESIIIGICLSGDENKAGAIIDHLLEGSVYERVIAINVAVEVPDLADRALLLAIPKKEGTDVISQALSRALYLIWRNDPSRAARIMDQLREQISYTNFVKHGFTLFTVLLEVTFKTLGVLHYKNEVIETLGEFWITLITQNLRMSRKGFFNQILGKSVKLTLINTIALFGNTLFKRHGVYFGKGDKAFTEEEKNAIRSLMDAWEPGSPAIGEVTRIMEKFGPDSIAEGQKNKTLSNIVVFFVIPACVGAVNHDPQKTIQIYNNTFDMAGDLLDHGRTTRFFTYSAVNFALQLNYPKLENKQADSHILTPVYETLHRWYLHLLDVDPEIFAKAEISEGTPNSSFGIFSQATLRMGRDLITDIVQPMLNKCEEGHTGLLKSYLRTSLFSLDTFSQRMGAHRSILKSYDYLLSIPDLAGKTGMDPSEMIHLFTEAYAVISVGYPSDVELFVINNRNLPAGFLEVVRQTRNKPSTLFEQTGKPTLEQYINSTLQAWTISDGGNSLLANFPVLRGIIDRYFRRSMERGDIAEVMAEAVRDLFDFLVEQSRQS